MTYTIFGNRISSRNICNRYGLTERDIADCFSDADEDVQKASMMIEEIIKTTPREELKREIGRRAGMRRRMCVPKPRPIETHGKIDVETDYSCG